MNLPQRSVLEKESSKTKSKKAKGKEIPSKKKHDRSKARAREIPRVIPREKEVNPHSQSKQWKGSKKTWYLPARPGGTTQENVERKTQEKVVRKEKTTTAGVAAKQRRFKSDLQ